MKNDRGISEVESDEVRSKCPIDGGVMNFVFEAEVLSRHRAMYEQCASCGLVQPRSPHWLDEAYSDVIALSDVGLVARNLVNAKRVEPLVERLAGPGARILDIGGGYGLLCRILRDRGLDCRTTDPYCENILAKGFEPEPDYVADVLLAFEVMEHLPDPLPFLGEQLEKYGAHSIIFSTLVHNGPEAPPKDWWYYTLETGQHVSLYQSRSLAILADGLGLVYHQISQDFHLFTRHSLGPIDRWMFGASGRYLRRLYSEGLRWRRRKKSLTKEDYLEVRKKMKDNISQ